MNEDQLQDVVEELHTVDGVQGSALTRKDGMLLAAKLPDTVDAEQLGAMMASTVGAGKHQAQALGISNVSHHCVRSQDGKLLSIHPSEDTVLTALVDGEVDVEDIVDELHTTADDIVQHLS